MGISARVSEYLRSVGHEVNHLRDERLQRLRDGDVFRKAAAERRVVLTFDLDFGEIAARCTGPWTSVILFRLVNTTNPHVIQRLRQTLPLVTGALEQGSIVVIEDSRVRIRTLPIAPTD